MKYEHRILIFALMTGLAGTVISLLLLWSSDYTIRIQLALTLLILLAWLGLAFTLKSKVVFPLRTLSNLLGALREGDYSLQARGACYDDALGEVILEANALAESLREQRLGAIEAMALLRKIMAEINVAMFGFDSSHRLRLVNDNGKHLLGRTDEQLYNCHASELGLADCLDEQTMIEAAIANRTDMIRMELRLAIDEFNIESARNATLPDITFDYNFGARTESGTVGRALENLANDSFSSHSIGLSASIPLGNEVAKARLQRTRLQRMQDLMTREQLQQRIRQEVREAVNDLRQNWRRILAAAQNLIAAENDYEVEQSQFLIGRSSSTEVLRRAGALGDAQLRKIRAFVGYEIAKVNLARTTGTLLGYGRIQLQPIDIEAE